MGAIDKFLNVMKFSEDDQDNEEGYYEEEEAAPVPKRSKNENSDGQEEKPSKRIPKFTGMKTNVKKNGGECMELCVIRPTALEDEREITETLLSNRAVLLNLEGLDTDIAQRIIDFSSGSCYAIRGNLQKISQYIFVITPASVEISGDFQDLFVAGTENGAGILNVPPMSE